ncbi:hypothetical protein [Amycolatopsis sp. YIM 10]|uniref:hypothetical protein n=1 Tax=Amycolatopsis sp. YIM 10 TaxID=2653857 RepID=UPI00128FEA1C|nr:hypothetical protein [Amycolatopsis sp. YIM 10]QFU90985.1 hypothetical protein YIM_29065 [Amycolatopsis sp. YIM 10]
MAETTETFTKGHMATLMTTALISIGFGMGWWFYGVTSAPDAATPLRIAGVVLCVALLAWTFSLGRRGRELPAGEGRGSSPFGRTYWIAVVVMVVAIFAGTRVLTAVLDLPQAGGTWVLFCVGAHFVPFAKLFGSTRFLVMVWLLCGIAVLAAVLGLAGLAWAWAAVTGFGAATVMWGMITAALLDGTKQITRQAQASLS